MADEEREEKGTGETEGHEDDAASKAQAAEEKHDQAKEKIEELEKGDPPQDLEDWPDDEAKYETFGGPEGQHSYAEGPEEKLGESGVRHHEDGSVSIDGEKVDNPDEFKGDPIPGGPTDPNSPDVDGEEEESSGEGGSGDSASGDSEDSGKDDREEQPAG